MLLEKWNSCTSIFPDTSARCTVTEATAPAHHSDQEWKPKRTSTENTKISRKARNRYIANSHMYAQFGSTYPMQLCLCTVDELPNYHWNNEKYKALEIERSGLFSQLHLTKYFILNYFQRRGRYNNIGSSLPHRKKIIGLITNLWREEK